MSYQAAAQYPGIPANLTLQFAEGWVRPRVSEKRFQHIKGVVDVCRRLAQAVHADTYPAELSGWLHDACKQVKDKELVQMAESFGMKLDPIEREFGHLLHGPVAAAVARKELGLESQEVLDAIAQHTLGAVPMSTLSQICFLGDCLEESRPVEYTAPIWAALDLHNQPDLDKAILVACDLNLKHLMETGKPIHPRTVEVRNYYLRLAGKAK